MKNTLSPVESTAEIVAIIPAIDDAMIARVSGAYSEGDSALVARVRALHAVLSAGHTVKGLHTAMVNAAVSDPSIDVQSTTTYGFAAAAATLAASIKGLPFSKVSRDDLALYIRAAKHLKVGAFKTAARNALGNLGDDAGADDALLILRETFTLALTVPRADNVKAAEKNRADADRTARTAGDGTESGDDSDDTSGTPRVADPAADVLAGIRAAVSYLAHGGDYSDDLASATAELTAALSAARKRARAAVAA